MDPNVRIFVRAIRAGKCAEQAFEEYCWARDAVPISKRDLERNGDPFQCDPLPYHEWAYAVRADEFGADKSDDEIAAEFEWRLSEDRGDGVLWRPMSKNERPTPGALVRAMGAGERAKAAEIFGVGNIAQMLISR